VALFAFGFWIECGVITGLRSKLQTVDGNCPFSIAACMSFSGLSAPCVSGTETWAVSVVTRCNRTDTEKDLAILLCRESYTLLEKLEELNFTIPSAG
jgi:hypothetical protein